MEFQVNVNADKFYDLVGMSKERYDEMMELAKMAAMKTFFTDPKINSTFNGIAYFLEQANPSTPAELFTCGFLIMAAFLEAKDFRNKLFLA